MANDVNKIKLLLLWDILCKHTDENHAINTDEIIELLAQKGISVSRKIVVSDIEALCNYGYEVLSYKKKYHYYYVVNRQLETAEVVLLADVIKSSKLPARQKNDLIEKLTDTLCLYQAESISKHLIIFDFGANITNQLLDATIKDIIIKNTPKKEISQIILDMVSNIKANGQYVTTRTRIITEEYDEDEIELMLPPKPKMIKFDDILKWFDENLHMYNTSECIGDREAFIEDFKKHFEYESNT